MHRQSRRRFLCEMAGLGLAAAGLGALAGCTGRSSPLAPAVGGERLETTSIRIGDSLSACLGPQYVAEQLLRDEGFTDVHSPRVGRVSGSQALASGEIHFFIIFVGGHIVQIDAGDPIVILAGIHSGCYELFSNPGIRSVRDLKGRTVGVTDLGSGRHIFFASALSYVGMDPQSDVRLVTPPPREAIQLLADRKLDAYQAFAPDPQEIRARKIGHVILNSGSDRPWSQYFCCVVGANREFVQRNPVATKRALRAILKANDMCAAEPQRAAQILAEKGIAPSFDTALEVLHDLPYDRWREFDHEDTVRFYSLRLYEIGMIRSTPDQIISRGTDWRFLNELKQELKA